MISANDDIWKPSSDYYLECSSDVYVKYNLRDDKKLITTFYIENVNTDNVNRLYFAYQILDAYRDSSDSSHHRFLISKKMLWANTTSGAMKETKYLPSDKKEIIINRERLDLSAPGFFLRTPCEFITAVQYKTVINNLENERDALIDKWIKDRKSKFKL